MAKWNGSNKAPKNMYRVIGSDTFSWPHEDYWIGDFADLTQAKQLAEAEAGAMNRVLIFEDGANPVFPSSSNAEKKI